MKRDGLLPFLLSILFVCSSSIVFAGVPGTMKWAFGTSKDITSSPAIGPDGTIYVGSDDSNLYAINPDGTKEWRFDTGIYSVNSSPAIGVDGTIYVGSGSKKLFAINPDGTQKWVFNSIHEFGSSPAIGPDGTIYAGAGSNCSY